MSWSSSVGHDDAASGRVSLIEGVGTEQVDLIIGVNFIACNGFDVLPPFQFRGLKSEIPSIKVDGEWGNVSLSLQN